MLAHFLIALDCATDFKYSSPKTCCFGVGTLFKYELAGMVVCDISVFEHIKILTVVFIFHFSYLNLSLTFRHRTFQYISTCLKDKCDLVFPLFLSFVQGSLV